MSYFDNLLKKIPKIKKILDNDKNSTIYHYTKPEKLLNILKSASIRFSNALYLNDKDELKKYMEELNMNPKNMERSLNVGFSGGEKKKNEILQMLVLNPKLAILDETDSGLDVDAIKTVSKGIEMFKNENNAVLIITHNTKILHSLKVDYVHVLVNGKIVKTGSQELAKEIEENGYAQYK